MQSPCKRGSNSFITQGIPPAAARSSIKYFSPDGLISTISGVVFDISSNNCKGRSMPNLPAIAGR